MSSLNRKDGKMSAKSSGAGKMHGPSFMIHNSNTIVPRKDPGESARRKDKRKKILVHRMGERASCKTLERDVPSG
jgi:hypothetical protein